MCGINRRLSESFVGSVVSGEKVWLVRTQEGFEEA